MIERYDTVKTKLRLRILSAALSVFTVFSLLSLVFPTLTHVSNAAPLGGGIVESKHYTSDSFSISAENWIGEGDTKLSPIPSSEGGLRIQSEAGNAAATATPTDSIDAADFREVGIFVRSLSNSICDATLTVKHSGGTSKVTEKLPIGDEYYLFVSLGEEAKEITEVSFSLVLPSERLTQNSTVVSAKIGGVVLSSVDHFETISKYSAFTVEGLGEDHSVSSAVPITGSPVVFGGTDGEQAARITLKGNGGGITFHFSEDGEDFDVYGSSVITKGRSTYIFPVGSITENSAYKIEFTGTDASDITLDAVDFIAAEDFDSDESLGSITKCTLADNTVYVTGGITRDTAVKYIDGKLCLYEVPMWQSADAVLNEEPVSSISMSTSFSFSLPISEDYSAFTSYIVAIRDKGEVYPLSDPIYPGTGYLPESEHGFIAVSGISPENAFSAGADKYIIEVDISSLFLEKSTHGSSVYTYDSYPYYPDIDITSQIRLKVQFLSASGIDVIFRINSGSRILSPASSDDCRTVAAAVSYLSDQFDPYGFISDLEGSDDGSVSNRAERCASFARLISAVAKSEKAVFTYADSPYDSETFIWLLSHYVSDYPKADHRFIIHLEGENIASLDSVAACAVDGGYGSGFVLDVDYGSQISVPDGEKYIYMVNVDENATFDISKNSNTVFSISEAVPDTHENSITLWDFTSSYDSDGFTVPAGPTAIFTGSDDALEDHTGIPACRCLKTVLGSDSHMIVARPKAPMNLTSCSKVEFLMSCRSDAPFTLDIVFISGNSRAVFRTEYSGDGIYSPVCDLSLTDIAEKIDRIAIFLRDGGSVELGIASVTAYGDGESEGAEDSLYITETESPSAVTEDGGTEEKPTAGNIYIAAGALIILTIVIFAAMSIKKQ